ncbi:MAG: hypothetical protein PWP60_1225 [Candidatus Atribacteria bacterium]|jgi:hypothetical protein|nr:hypothetical protein [Candidatus Atribacteria bacterium]
MKRWWVKLQDLKSILETMGSDAGSADYGLIFGIYLLST